MDFFAIIRNVTQEYCRERGLPEPYPAEPDVDFYDHDDDYKRQDAGSRRNISNHDQTEDNRLDDPRRGQAADINRRGEW